MEGFAFPQDPNMQMQPPQVFINRAIIIVLLLLFRDPLICRTMRT